MTRIITDETHALRRRVERLEARVLDLTAELRRLLPKPLANYYAESKLDGGKDDDILLTKKLIIMDDEFGGKSKFEAKRFKELTSKAFLNSLALWAHSPRSKALGSIGRNYQ